MSALVCVAIVWANFAYLLTTAPLLVARRRRSASDSYLGRWGWPVNLLAVVWGVLLVVNVGWPRERFYGPAWAERHLAVIGTGFLFALGLAVFALVRRRTGGST
jgi:hypothetical protein